MSLRLIFMGTPEFSVPTLTALIGHGHDIAAAYTQPPRAAGRGMAARRSPVHVAAEQFGLPVETPRSLKDPAAAEHFAKYEADAAVVVAYGLILPEAILAGPPLGCWNGHASLLPRWRGAAPIQRAIIAGDTESGVMVMRMAPGLDTGPVAMAEKIAIGPEMTAGELHDALSRICADLMVRAMGALERGQLDVTPQEEAGATYAEKIAKAETRIDWSKPARRVHDHIRGLSPYPGAWCEMPVGSKHQRVKILRAEPAEGEGAPGAVLDDQLLIACGEAAIRPQQLQREGRQAQDRAAFLRGNPIARGETLS